MVPLGVELIGLPFKNPGNFNIEKRGGISREAFERKIIYLFLEKMYKFYNTKKCKSIYWRPKTPHKRSHKKIKREIQYLRNLREGKYLLDISNETHGFGSDNQMRTITKLSWKSVFALKHEKFLLAETILLCSCDLWGCPQV